MTTENTNKPVQKIKVGNVQIAIWKHNSENGSFYKASVELSYRDGEGAWHNKANSYGLRDLLNLTKAALLAHSAIMRLERADKQTGGGETDEEAGE